MCHEDVLAWYDVPTTEQAEVMAEAVDKFLPLVTCNRCYDAYDDRQRSGKAIADACYGLAVCRPEKRTAEMLATARRVLENAVPAYGKAITRLYRAPTVIYHSSSVDLLIEKPEHSARILKEWRDEIWRSARAGRQQQQAA